MGGSKFIPWILVSVFFLSLCYGIILVVPQEANAYVFHNPITIASDSDFTGANGVSAGTGTVGDPYIIQGHEISAAGGTAINVSGTNAYFVILDCYVHSSVYGISFKSVANASIESCVFSDNDFSISIYDSTGVAVTQNDVAATDGCISVAASTDCSVTRNLCTMMYGGDCIVFYQSTSVQAEENEISYSGNGVYVWECSSAIVKSNLINGSGCQIQDSQLVSVWNNTFIYSGIALGGTEAWAYESLDISTNNTANGLPIRALIGEVGGSIGSIDAGQVIIANCSGLAVHDLAVDMIYWTAEPWVYKGGVECYISDNITFSNMTITNCGNGFTSYMSENITLSDSTMTDCRLGTQILGTNHTQVIDSELRYTVAGGSATAMYLKDSDHATVKGCNISFSGPHGPMHSRSGISLHTYNDTLVENCTLTNMTGSGIGSWGQGTVHSQNLTVRNCRVSDSTIGLDLSFTAGVVLENNSLVGNYAGAWPSMCSDMIIRNNSIMFNRQSGLEFESVNTCNISRNWIVGNVYGIWMDDSSYHVDITENSFRDNQHGIEESCDDMAVYHNDFIDNDLALFTGLAVSCVWDNGYPSGGNYFSDYGGSDSFSGPGQDISGSDGIGDTPYVVNSTYGYEDRYPLMNPVMALGTSPVAAISVAPASGDIFTLFELDATGSSDVETQGYNLWARWDFDGDGTWDTDWTTDKVAYHQYLSPGIYTVRLEVCDSQGLSNISEIQLEVTGIIPEFPTVALPVLSLLIVITVAAEARLRKSRT